MSIENHPNINAAGLTSDIITAIVIRLRGAAKEREAEALGSLSDLIVEFATRVSITLDDKFGAHV